MAIVTVFRHVPQPIIGVIGTHFDPAFETFEADLDWLETTGMLVERFDPRPRLMKSPRVLSSSSCCPPRVIGVCR